MERIRSVVQFWFLSGWIQIVIDSAVWTELQLYILCIRNKPKPCGTTNYFNILHIVILFHNPLETDHNKQGGSCYAMKAQGQPQAYTGWFLYFSGSWEGTLWIAHPWDKTSTQENSPCSTTLVPLLLPSTSTVKGILALVAGGSLLHDTFNYICHLK